jgi:hypothetical protein
MYNNGFLSVDFEKLYKEYFNSIDFNDFSIFKIEKMYNDMRIMLRLIDSFKQNFYKQNVNNNVTTSPKLKSAKKIHSDNSTNTSTNTNIITNLIDI